MGLIRLILAITVVINHAAPLFGLVFTDAYLAIKIFFIISGFYMSLILTEKYTGPGHYRLFITNRLLRLFPTYWLTMLISILISLFYITFYHASFVLGPWLTKIHQLDVVSIITLATANLSILGQDILFFSCIDPATGALSFVSDAINRGLPAWIFLIIPQAWTLALEIMFYILAPFLVRRRPVLLACLVTACFAFRAWVYHEGLPFDPWKQRFFPAELGFFLLGAISYAVYARIKNANVPERLQQGVTGFFIAFLLAYQFLPGDLTKEIFTYVLTTGSLPFIFNCTKKIKFDRALGELSYPVYIVHWTIIMLTRSFFGAGYLTELSILFSIAASLLINHYFANRIEMYRQKRIYAPS